ncbi:hypothetical protein D3C83_02110 [compost metagenome]
MFAGECGLEILVGRELELRAQQRRGCLEARAGRGIGKGERAAADVLDFADRAVGVNDDLHLIAELALVRCHHRRGNKPGAVDGERSAAARESRDVQTPGAHRLDLGGVGLHGEEHHFLAGQLFHVPQERVPCLAVDLRVLHRRVGKDQRAGIEPLPRISRRIGDQVAIAVAKPAVQRPVRARLRERRIAEPAAASHPQDGPHRKSEPSEHHHLSSSRQSTGRRNMQSRLLCVPAAACVLPGEE